MTRPLTISIPPFEVPSALTSFLLRLAKSRGLRGDAVERFIQAGVRRARERAAYAQRQNESEEVSPRRSTQPPRQRAKALTVKGKQR